jgi:hypothetical protein
MSDLPRTSLERVLARAVELQHRSGDEPSDVISEARLEEIAREVGLDVQHVRQALAEERAQVPMMPSGGGTLLEAIGPASVGAQRTVAGTPETLLRHIESLLPRSEYMTCVRRTRDRLVWEPRRDPFGNFLRSLGSGGRRFDLVRVDQLVVSATAIDDTRSVLRFDAVMDGARRSARSGVAALAAVLLILGLMVAMPLLFVAGVVPQLAAMLAALYAAIAGGATWLTWRGLTRQFRRMAGRVQQRIEYLLDEAEHGRLEPPPSLLDRMLKG